MGLEKKLIVDIEDINDQVNNLYELLRDGVFDENQALCGLRNLIEHYPNIFKGDLNG